MNRHSWSNRIYPPLVAVLVVGGVWYAIEHRDDPPTYHATTSRAATPANKHIPTQSDTTSLPVPTVQRINGQLQFGIDSKQISKIQKVEYYIEGSLIGAAFNEPYSLVVNEVGLHAGEHQVVARVYTPEATSQTPPTTFSTAATPTQTVATPTNTSQGNSNPVSDAPQTPQQSTVVLPGKPTQLQITGATGTSVALSWGPPVYGSPAAKYEVWRDGTIIGTVLDTTFTDTSIGVGVTHEYRIVAIDSQGNASDPSESVYYTVPAAPADTQPASTPEAQPSQGL